MDVHIINEDFDGVRVKRVKFARISIEIIDLKKAIGNKV